MSTLSLSAAFAWLSHLPVYGQTPGRAAEMRAAISHLVGAGAPIVTQPPTITTEGTVSVHVTFPMGVHRYHVLEQQKQTIRPATDSTAISTSQVRTVFPLGNTIMFMEKAPPAPVNANAATTARSLFATYMLKSTPPERAGAPLRSVTGTLTMLADVPTPWDVAGNAYVTRLSVLFLTEDKTPNNALLPMVVEFTGENVKSIQPHKIELVKANVDGSKEILVTCDGYQRDVKITAHYQATSTTRPLVLQPLTPWVMTQMIISVPMLFSALSGGLIGGLLRLFKSAKRNASRTVHYLAEGAVVGLVTVTMLLSGLLRSQIAGLTASPQLVLAFALAAAAGSVGAHFLDAAVSRLRGKKKIA